MFVPIKLAQQLYVEVGHMRETDLATNFLLHVNVLYWCEIA